MSELQRVVVTAPANASEADADEGAGAQRALCGLESPEHSMLPQSARAAARRQRVGGELPTSPLELM